MIEFKKLLVVFYFIALPINNIKSVLIDTTSPIVNSVLGSKEQFK